MKLVVVTVNYCSAQSIIEGLPEVASQVADLGNSEFWIVDNCSPDGSAQQLEDFVAGAGLTKIVKIIRSKINDGFGAGNNVAVNQAMTLKEPPEYFYFLNPDAIPKPNAIKRLVGFMDKTPSAAISGGVLCDEHGEIEASSFRFPSFWSEVETAINFGPVYRLLKGFTLPLPSPQKVEEVDWVSGASFIARKSVLDKTGAFDEAFFLYWEEVELCHRVKKAGYSIYAIPDAKVVHIGGVTTGMSEAAKRIPEYWFASRSHLLSKTGLTRSVLATNIGVVVSLALRRLLEIVRRRELAPPNYTRDFIKFNFFRKPNRKP